MDARMYKTNLVLSPVDFPPIMGLGQSTVCYHSEPHLNRENILLSITIKYVLTNMSTNKDHDILSVKSDYEIPCTLIRKREDVYEFYKDATLSLNEAYQYARMQLPALPQIIFPNQPIEKYNGEIDRIFNLLNSQN